MFLICSQKSISDQKQWKNGKEENTYFLEYHKIEVITTLPFFQIFIVGSLSLFMSTFFSRAC